MLAPERPDERGTKRGVARHEGSGLRLGRGLGRRPGPGAGAADGRP